MLLPNAPPQKEDVSVVSSVLSTGVTSSLDSFCDVDLAPVFDFGVATESGDFLRTSIDFGPSFPFSFAALITSKSSPVRDFTLWHYSVHCNYLLEAFENHTVSVSSINCVPNSSESSPWSHFLER